MVKTTLEMFREELLRTGSYATAPDHMPPKPRKPGRYTTFRFCWNTFSVFPRSSIAETFGYLTTDLWAHDCFRSVQIAERFGIPFYAEGWNNRRDYKGPVVYLANHMSTLETILLPFMVLTYGPFSTVVKRSLAYIPGLVKASAHLGLIPIGRVNPREDLMTIFKVGGERIARGESVLIFAQGRRLPVFKRKDWSSIGTKLAEKMDVPVVPIAVKTDVMPTRPGGKGWFKDFGTVDPTKEIRLACGPVMKGPSRETVKTSFDWIKAKLDSWGLPTED